MFKVGDIVSLDLAGSININIEVLKISTYTMIQPLWNVTEYINNWRGYQHFRNKLFIITDLGEPNSRLHNYIEITELPTLQYIGWCAQTEFRLKEFSVAQKNEATITLDSSQIRSLLQDAWDWKTTFMAVNSGYSDTAASAWGGRLGENE